VPRKIGIDEQKVAQFVLQPVGIAALGNLRRKFEHFLVELVDHKRSVRPVEADARSAVLKLDGAGKRGQGKRHIVENVRLRKAFRRFLFRLDFLPASFHGACAALFLVAEDMRMPPYHLFADRLHDAGKIEAAFFLRHLRVEHDLQKEIAKFVLEVVHVTAFDRIGNLVSFLDRVGRDACEILLEVPRTAAVRIAQARHDVEQRFDPA
jgi:hypothetical protein